MCRLFALRSDRPERVHTPLVDERNSLGHQSREHEDGWGIASWPEGRLEIARGFEPAHQDSGFAQASGAVFAPTVLAHVRRASVGAVGPDNSHPFVHDGFAFAHNGTLQDFERRRAAIEALIAPELCTLLRGETDSERCFLLFLTLLRERASGRPSAQQLAVALARTVRTLERFEEPSQSEPSSMNFLVTDGSALLALRRHRSLHIAPRIPGDQLPTPGTRLERLVIASEMIGSEKTWFEVPENWVVGVDERLEFFSCPCAELT